MCCLYVERIKWRCRYDILLRQWVSSPSVLLEHLWFVLPPLSLSSSWLSTPFGHSFFRATRSHQPVQIRIIWTGQSVQRKKRFVIQPVWHDEAYQAPSTLPSFLFLRAKLPPKPLQLLPLPVLHTVLPQPGGTLWRSILRPGKFFKQRLQWRRECW